MVQVRKPGQEFSAKTKQKNQKKIERRLRLIRYNDSRLRTKPESLLPKPRNGWQGCRKLRQRNRNFWRLQKPTKGKRFDSWRFGRPWDNGSANTKEERPSRATKEAQPRRGSRLGQLAVLCCSKPGLGPLGPRRCESSKEGSKTPQRWSSSCWSWTFLASGRKEL